MKLRLFVGSFSNGSPVFHKDVMCDTKIHVPWKFVRTYMVSEIYYICFIIQVNMVKEKTEYFRAVP